MPIHGDPTPVPAGIWIRVSTGSQDEANQLPDAEKHCAAKGYAIAKRYTVHGKSASKGKHQPDLDKMLADMRAGVIKVLVIWHSDRIERRPGKALLDLLAEVSAAGGRVESVKEPMLGQLDFGSQVTTFIAGLVNAEKSRHLSEQVGAAIEKISKNEALTGRPPWGYRTTGEKYHKRLVPTAQGRKYVPEIFARCIAGDSLETIARWLDAQGARPPGGGRWWPRRIGQLIRTPTYMGYRADAAGRTVHCCEALADALTFRRAGEALDTRPKRGPLLEHRAMLTGVIFCPRCEDSPMYRIISGSKGRYAYYRCTGRGAGRKSCGNMARCDVIDAAVCQIAAATFKWRKVTITRHIPGSNHEAELAGVAFELKQLGADFAAERVSDEDYAQRFAGLVAERKRLKALPAIADTWAEIELDETYADRWDALEPAERGPWLAVNGFRAEASRDRLRLSQPGHPRQVAATVTLTSKKAAAA